MRIILSPHLDDAVLSCGASIAHWTAAGDPVLVMTVFAGRPAGVSLSDFALQLHLSAGAGEDLVAVRRAEDHDACDVVGADCLHLEYLDAPYRTDPAGGGFLYSNNRELMGGIVHPSDQWTVDELAESLAIENGRRDSAVWYAPLGAGGHVDHILVHAVARRLEQVGAQVLYYEDYPYVENGHALVAALARSGSTGWRPVLSRVSRRNLQSKCEAIALHQSQLALLFGSAENMQRMVVEYASRAGTSESPAERLWSPC